MKNNISGLLLLIFIFSCERQEEHYINDCEFFVALTGDLYHTSKNSFRITQIEDSRCPIEANCITAGNVKVYFSFYRSTIADTTLLLWDRNFDHPRLLVDSHYFELKSITLPFHKKIIEAKRLPCRNDGLKKRVPESMNLKTIA
jgi:hypothetical protein